MKLYEVAYGSVAARNKIVNETEFKKLQRQAVKDNQELYRSVYTYDEKILEHLGVKKTVKGYIGSSELESIIIDYDKGELSDEALLGLTREKVKAVIEEWKLPSECVRMWYSGTGYHAVFPNFFNFPKIPKLSLVVKATLSKYFEGIDTSIYDPVSIIRVANTINPKVRRYKIYLTTEEFFHLQASEIIKLSEENRIIKVGVYDPEEIPSYSDKIIYPESNPKVKQSDNVAYDLTNKTTCMQKAYLAGPKQGTRHKLMLRIASAWRRGGMPELAITRALQAWDPTFDPYAIEKNVKSIFDANNKDGYNYGCHDELMVKFCDELCVFHKNKDYLPTMITHHKMEENFVNFLRSDFKTKSIDLMKILGIPDKSHIIIPGENILCFGNSGIGKTAFAQNIALRANHLKVLYGNFEFTTNLLYRRFVQIKDRLSKEEVMRHYMVNNNSLSKGLEHIQIIDDSIDIKGLYQMIESYQPGLVILDTLMKVRTPDKSEYSKSVTLSNLFKKLAKDYGLIVMAINHIPKASATDNKGNPHKLNQHSGKGSGDLENMSDHVIMIEGREDNDIRTISAGKARDESKFKLSFKYEWNTFNYQYIGK